MTAVLAMDSSPLILARLVLAHPAGREEGELLAACEVLQREGLPADVERADRLVAEIVARAVAELNGEPPARHQLGVADCLVMRSCIALAIAAVVAWLVIPAGASTGSVGAMSAEGTV
jgi:hypothetical protein